MMTQSEKNMVKESKARIIHDCGRIYKDAPSLKQAYKNWESYRMILIIEKLTKKLEKRK